MSGQVVSWHAAPVTGIAELDRYRTDCGLWRLTRGGVASDGCRDWVWLCKKRDGEQIAENDVPSDVPSGGAQGAH